MPLKIRTKQPIDVFLNVRSSRTKVQCTIFHQQRSSSKSGFMYLTGFNMKPLFQSAVQITMFQSIRLFCGLKISSPVEILEY